MERIFGRSRRLMPSSHAVLLWPAAVPPARRASAPPLGIQLPILTETTRCYLPKGEVETSLILSSQFFFFSMAELPLN